MHDTHINDIPHLQISLSSPFTQFVDRLHEQEAKIEAWLRDEFDKTPAPLYASVDLRHAGFKLAPIDTNLFPAGFNNLAENTYATCVAAIKQLLASTKQSIETVLVLIEGRSRNPMYFDNVASLQHILGLAGLNVTVGVLPGVLQSPREVSTPSGKPLTIHPVERSGDHLIVGDSKPDFVLLNQDLSEGVPSELQQLQQPMMPPPTLGWASRLKSSHFQHVSNVATAFAEQFDIDSWAISPLFRYCGEINFMTREGEDCLVKHADTLFKAVAAKYKEYGVNEQPYLVIKADAGTYGMAVMTLKSLEEIRNLNRKQRQKMSSIKGGREVTRVIIQEGVHTLETWGKDEAAAEPVLYMIGERVVGGFYRLHSEQGIDQNLNVPGMQFASVGCEDHQDLASVRCYSYSVVARLALLAAAREQKES